MPRDGELLKPRAPLRPGLAGLAQLRDELRKPMPEGFEWDYSIIREPRHCGSAGCALGLGQIVWPEHAETVFLDRVIAAIFFDLSPSEGIDLFCLTMPHTPPEDVPAWAVADEIDRLLREKGYVEEGRAR